MIPQDPVLFSGSVRFNVDPFAAAPDAAVLDALKDAKLADRVAGDRPLDEAVQIAIRSNFRESTVVCIAHRINTIADYDRVLVLDDGVVLEDGNPAELLSDPNSQFAKLAAAHDEGV